jgi:hypothetical protein
LQVFLVSATGAEHTGAAVDDSIVIKIPTREWALCAIDDLAAEGIQAELLDQTDDAGLHQLLVCGCEESINVIRYELHIAENRVCWESFVNAAIAG